MGIDAEMFVRTRAPVTDTEIRRLSWRLGRTLGHSNFFIDRPDSEHSYEPHHCLERISVYEQDGDDVVPEPGETFIRCHIWTRYYGPGYERGDLPLIVMVAEWLERNIPGAVWYGGNSSGVLAAPFGREARDALVAHFCSDKGRDYWMYQLGSETRGIPAPYCTFCDMPTSQRMFGGRGLRAGFLCDGCGWSILTDDGGQTWAPWKAVS